VIALTRIDAAAVWTARAHPSRLEAFLGPAPGSRTRRTRESNVMKKLANLVLVATFGFVSLACGASPEAVCDHMIELSKKELGEEAAKSLDRADCIKGAEHQKEMQGMMKYRTTANCITDATTLEAAMKCDK
jgi:hypothetical protein